MLPAAVLALVAGCGSGATPDAGATSTIARSSAAVSSSPSPSPSPSRSPSPSSKKPTAAVSPALPHFATPQEAGRYLAEKWNAKDAAAMHHITNGDSRAALDDMRSFATRLTLDMCTKNDDHTFTCEFTHGFLPGKSDPDSVPTDATHDGPAATSDPHHGRTALKAVAVAKTGWYFNVFLYCG